MLLCASQHPDVPNDNADADQKIAGKLVLPVPDTP